jgi:hypothetical protein
MMILKTSRANLSSNDQCSLDLPFAETKSLTARVGPTPVFTRGSGATYIGSDGLIHGIDTSTTSNTIGTGSRTFTLDATAGQDQFWRAGDAVEASNGGNSMVGTVTSYDASTQVLVCNITSIAGTGTFTSWRIGYRGPRFDHTSAGVCRGLLIEESRTNLITQSGNASSWPNANGTVTNNGSTTAPDGSSNGFLGGIGTANLITTATSSVTGLHTASVFLKRNNTDWARLQLAQGSFAHAVNFWVNLATGAAGTLAVAVGTPTSLSAQVTPFGNSWYRVSITASYPATASLTLAIISATADNNTTRVSGSVYEVWAGQLEAGSFPTSYIPTTTGTLARSADVCSITGGNFNNFYNQSEGTMLANAFTPASGDRTVLAADDNTSNEMIRLRTEGTNPFFKVTDGGSELVAIDAGTVSANTSFKLIGAYKLDDFASSINGGAAGTDTSGTTPTVDRMRIGAGQGGNTMCGCVASLRYYRKRLPNAKLQALTV